MSLANEEPVKAASAAKTVLDMMLDETTKLSSGFL